MKAEPIAKTLEAVFRQISSVKKDGRQALSEALTAALDNKEIRHICLDRLQNKVLTLRVDSPAWMYAFNLKKNKLLKTLQEKTSSDIINEIRFRIGTVKQN